MIPVASALVTKPKLAPYRFEILTVLWCRYGWNAITLARPEPEEKLAELYGGPSSPGMDIPRIVAASNMYSSTLVVLIIRNPTIPYRYRRWVSTAFQKALLIQSGAAAENRPVEEARTLLGQAARAEARQAEVAEVQARYGLQPKHPNRTCLEEVVALSRMAGMHCLEHRQQGVE